LDEWRDPLRWAGDWFEGIMRGFGPGSYSPIGRSDLRKTLTDLGPLTKYASQTLIWMDIFGAITDGKSPRFFDLYNLLFDTSDDGEGIMEATNGSSDSIMLALAKIADLAAWKEDQEQNHALSNPDLIRRGNEIQAMLYPPSLFDGYQRASNASQQTNLKIKRRGANDVFREAAMLYLQTILSGSFPRVQPIRDAVWRTKAKLDRVDPTSEVNRSLVFPICLAGCTTEDPVLYQYFHNRLMAVDSPVGNVRQAKVLMEHVWEKRMEGQMTVSWRDVMKEMGTSLLLV